MQIGEFAKLCGTRVSLLRHYDRIGLLRPAYTDVVTGYRYYAPGQAETYRLISALKEAGFSLPETRRLLSLTEDGEDATPLFEQKRAALAGTLAALEKAQDLWKGANVTMEELCFNEDLDFPFADDPEAVGKWTVLGRWRSRDEFYAGKKPDTEVYGEQIREIYFLPGGETYWAYGWTKGKLLIDEYKNPHWETYKIEEIDGETYMLLDHKGYEYLVSGKTELVALKKADSRAYTRREIARRDDLDKPFIDDPAVIGNWRTWGFCQTKEDFSTEPEPEEELYWKSVEFFPGGSVTSVYEDEVIEGDDRQTWTKGCLLRKFNDCACEYEIRTVDGVDYLLIEWKSGDWRWGGFDTNYYIFVRDIQE